MVSAVIVWPFATVWDSNGEKSTRSLTSSATHTRWCRKTDCKEISNFLSFSGGCCFFCQYCGLPLPPAAILCSEVSTRGTVKSGHKHSMELTPCVMLFYLFGRDFCWMKIQKYNHISLIIFPSSVWKLHFPHINMVPFCSYELSLYGKGQSECFGPKKTTTCIKVFIFDSINRSPMCISRLPWIKWK